MRMTIAAIGKLKAGPERVLFERYLDRARKAGRGIGLVGPDLIELPQARNTRARDRKDAEAASLLDALPARRALVTLDEGGKSLSSEDFATCIGRWRDAGGDNVAFVIGGADGHGEALLRACELKLAFGAMTWPHQMVRIMLAEQIYRSIAILSAHPYHRA